MPGQRMRLPEVHGQGLMGIRLVGAALNPDWAHLSDRAHRVLVHMCYVAKDTSTNGQAAATYWAGHDVLILTCLDVDPDIAVHGQCALAEPVLRTALLSRDRQHLVVGADRADRPELVRSQLLGVGPFAIRAPGPALA